MRLIYDTLAWILAILLMAVWMVLAALCCLLWLPLTAWEWIASRWAKAPWETLAAVLVLAVVVVAALTYRAPSRLNGGVWTATVRPIPWPETGPGLVVRPITHFARPRR